MTKRDEQNVGAELQPLRDTLAERAKASGLDTAWLDERWWPEVRDAHGRIGPYRVMFFVVRIGQVFGAAALPVFATAGTLTTTQFWGWVTVAVSLVIALLVAFDHVFRPGVRWRVAYQTFHQLVDAAWAYLAAPVQAPDANQQFVQSTEQTIADERRNYLQDIANLNTSADGMSDVGRPARASQRAS
jgi:hypothetical protein